MIWCECKNPPSFAWFFGVLTGKRLLSTKVRRASLSCKCSLLQFLKKYFESLVLRSVHNLSYSYLLSARKRGLQKKISFDDP